MAAFAIVILLGVLLLGLQFYIKVVLILQFRFFDLSRSEDLLFALGIPVFVISLAVPVLIIRHWMLDDSAPQ